MSRKQVDTVQRYRIADYINVAPGGEKYELMGSGFNTLDESPSAQLDTKTYINDVSATSNIKSYQTQFAFDTDLVPSEAAVMFLYDIGRNQKTGVDAQTDYVRIEKFQPIPGKDNTFPARRFNVSVEVSSFAGAGGETIKVTGTLHNVGSFEDGEFNIETKTFTPIAVTTRASTTSATTTNKAEVKA